jgi:hypothetical protein
MNAIFHLGTLLPICLLIIQGFIFLLVFTSILKRFNILKIPYAGIEYSQLIVASSFLFGMFFITTASIEGTFQAFKTFQNDGARLFVNTVNKFSQFFLVILLFEIIFALTSLFVAHFFFGIKKVKQELDEGNIPASVLVGIIVIGFSLILQFSAKEVIQYITPQYINFR